VRRSTNRWRKTKASARQSVGEKTGRVTGVNGTTETEWRWAEHRRHDAQGLRRARVAGCSSVIESARSRRAVCDPFGCVSAFRCVPVLIFRSPPLAERIVRRLSIAGCSSARTGRETERTGDRNGMATAGARGATTHSGLRGARVTGDRRHRIRPIRAWRSAILVCAPRVPLAPVLVFARHRCPNGVPTLSLEGRSSGRNRSGNVNGATETQWQRQEREAPRHT
jgi:hypothetical protein